MRFVSLTTKLLLSTLAACTLIVLVVSFVDLLRFQEAEKARIREEFARFEKGAMVTIRETVWHFDWGMVQTILDTQTSQVISFIEICDDNVAKCLQHGNRDLSPYLELRLPMIYGETSKNRAVEIGTIYLQSHYQTFPTHLFRDLPKLLLTNILSVFSIALVLFALFHRQVVKRLLDLERYTSRIEVQQLDRLPSLGKGSRGTSKDEVDLLGEAVTGLLEKTRAELDRRQTLEKQLNQAQKMEALGNLAGGIAHDFNNILAAILGFAELSRTRCEPDSVLYLNLTKILGAAQRARNLTSQILVFSRRTESQQEVLAVAQVVEEALGLIRASVPANVSIATDLDPTLRIKGDSTRLHQVIMNIAANGAQAIGDSNGTLRIALRSVELNKEEAEALVLPPGPYCCLEIADDGDGIPEEIQPRIFEPFFTTKQAGQGTGMGLAVVHGIVQSHGGSIAMESSLGVGTSFSIYLPLTEKIIRESARLPSNPMGSGQHIILVDDEPQVLEMGEALLKNLGYNVMACSRPDDALAYLRKEEAVDLLITDLTMPEMSGVELAALSKAHRPRLPVMLWTGYKDDVAAESLRNKVVDHILQKPFDIDELAAAVNQALRR